MARAASPLLLVALAACDPSASDGPGASAWTLHRSFVTAGRIELHAAPGALRARADDLAARLEETTPYAARVIDAVVDGSTAAAPRMVLATSDDARALALGRPLGLEGLEGGGFALLGREYRGRGDALLATFEDPERPGVPLILALGNDAAVTARLVDEIPDPARPRLRVWAGGDPALDATLSIEGAPAGDVEDLAARRARLWDGAARLEVGPGLDVACAGPSREPLALDAAEPLATARDRVASWLGEEPPTLQVLLLDHVEDLASCFGSAEPPRANPVAPRVHAVAAPGVPDVASSAVARAAALAIAGEPASGWMLDGIAVAAAGSWWGSELEAWAGHLASAGLAPGVDDLVADDAPRRLDEHVLVPLRGLLFAVLARDREPAELRRLWNEGAELPDAALRAGYEDALRRASAADGARRAAREAARAASVAAPFRNGVALDVTFEENGAAYGSRALGESLARARELGADAFSLTVFATLEPLDEAVVPRAASVHASSSDLALAFALAAGAELGMRPLLVVQPLAAPWGSWADDVGLSSDRQRDGVFARCERIGMHYALLAELLGVDVLCFGAELGAISPSLDEEGAPSPGLRRAQLAAWDALIGRLRAAFGGALTYAARLRPEAGRIGFWDRLDFVGVQLFSSVTSDEGPPGDPDLLAALRRELSAASELGRRWKRPTLVVQVGFPSRAAAWNNPAVPRGAIDGEAQRRYYAALAAALDEWREPEERREPGGPAGGLFLWSWPADATAGGARDGGYTPRGKPAESLLPRLFAR